MKGQKIKLFQIINSIDWIAIQNSANIFWRANVRITINHFEFWLARIIINV